MKNIKLVFIVWVVICFASSHAHSQSKDVKIDEEKIKLYRQTGISNYFEYNYDEAVKKLSFVIRFKPDDHEAIYYRGLCRMEMGDPKSALNDFTKCTIIEDNNADYYYKLGDIYVILGKYELAIKQYSSSIEICEAKPNDIHKKMLPEIYFQRAFAKMKMTNTIGACEDLKKSAELKFSDAEKTSRKYCK